VTQYLDEAFCKKYSLTMTFLKGERERERARARARERVDMQTVFAVCVCVFVCWYAKSIHSLWRFSRV
jgi:hypothetical protein